MNNKKIDKTNRHKKMCNSTLNSDDKDKISTNDNKANIVTCKLQKSKATAGIRTKFQTTIDSNTISEVPDDCKNKSFLTMSLKMNRYFPSDGFDNKLKFEDIDPLNYLSSSKHEKNGKPKLEKTCKSKICGSCKNSSTKIKYKSHKAQLHVSIKSKKPISCTHYIDKNDGVCDGIESDCSNSKIKHGNCPGSCVEPGVRRSELLLHFLNEMRNIVRTKDLQMNPLRLFSERLTKDKKNAELLLLMDLIIRFQVSKVKEIIFQDLLSEKIIPVNFSRVFLKQYEFLKSLSVAYSNILKDFESNFLILNDLSFDLMNRAHFKIHLYDDCKEIQDLIDSGHFNVKDELIFDFKTSDKEKERIRIIFSDMKSDFETSTKWKEVQKKTESIVKSSCDVGKSLLKYFHSHYTVLGHRKSDSKRGSFDADNYINSLRDLAACNVNIHLNDLTIKSLNNLTNVLGCGLKAHQSGDYDFETSFADRYYSTRRSSSSNIGLKMNCQKIYKSLANIKPPSLSRSSSSTNSNGYNSCVSTSSFEDSSDDDERDRESAKILYNLKHERNGCDSFSSNVHDNSVNEETKPPTPVSFNGDEDCESRFDDNLDENHKRFVFSDKEHSWNNSDLNHDDIEKFNKLYEKYLAENEHLLLDNSINSSYTHMSVPDCIKSLQSAESLHSLLSSIMDKCKKGLDIHDKKPCHSTTHFPTDHSDSEHIFFSSNKCAKHSDNICPNFTDDNFALDPALIGLKDDDFEMDFEELSRTLSPKSAIHDNLKEMEKYLGRSTDNSVNSDKTHPHLHALVKTCRIYCNKLYKRNSKDELKVMDSIDSLTDSCRNNRHSTDTKQTTIVIEQISDDESCGGHDDCTSTMNVDIDSNQENCSNNNISINNNLSSSETGSNGSTGADNVGNSKVCNCCKCEMFGEQNYLGHSRNATNVVEKLRLKLQKRKQCQMKSQSKKSTNNNNNNSVLNKQFIKLQLEDVDTLVKFINGDDDALDVHQMSSTHSQIASPADTTTPITSKKSKSKKPDIASAQTKCKSSKSSVSTDDVKASIAQNVKTSKKIAKTTLSSEINGGLASTNNNVQPNNKPVKNSVNNDNRVESKSNKPVLKDKSTNKEYLSTNTEISTIPSCESNDQHHDEEKDVYDPVVEDFKRFCEKVIVVPKRRKKLPIDPKLLISELEKCQQENNNSNLFK